MVRVHIICEGQTEETFINEVLMPDFSRKGIYLYPALIGRPGGERGRGGRLRPRRRHHQGGEQQ